jgi:hypothetical protein
MEDTIQLSDLLVANIYYILQPTKSDVNLNILLFIKNLFKIYLRLLINIKY